MHDSDRTAIDALSWRLGSELVRRHPHNLGLDRGHPGDGLYDCLMIQSRINPVRIMLNRVGTIQVHGTVGSKSDWLPASWEQYLRADPKAFLLDLERSAGLRAPSSIPATTVPVLIYRLFATLSALRSKTISPYTFEQGYIDSSGYDAGPNSAIDAFPAAAARLREERSKRPDEEPGFKYWMVFEEGEPRLAFEREAGSVWTATTSQPASLMVLYDKWGRNVDQTALRLMTFKGA